MSVPALPAQGIAAALPQSPAGRVRVFAMCAGRLSALVEHQRLFDGAASERSEQVRDGFLALLEAALPDALDYGLPGGQAMDWRVDAKMAEAALLHNATFHFDARRKARAAAAAERTLAECRGLLLG